MSDIDRTGGMIVVLFVALAAILFATVRNSAR
jgi:hypothetical protein